MELTEDDKNDCDSPLGLRGDKTLQGRDENGRVKEKGLRMGAVLEGGGEGREGTGDGAKWGREAGGRASPHSLAAPLLRTRFSIPKMPPSA